MERGRALAAYVSAWAQETEEGIRQTLSGCWTETSTYINPITDVVQGVDGLTSLILDLPVMFPGARFGAAAEPDVHHGAACLPWRLESTAPIRTLGRDFGRTLEGVDFVEFDDSGRISRITAFFASGTAPAPDPDPERAADRSANGRQQPALR